MRKIVAGLLMVAAAGCGTSSSSNGEQLAGMIKGQPFAPAEIVFVGPKSSAGCTFDGMSIPDNVNVSAVTLAFSAQAGVCDLAKNPCQARKNFTYASGVLAHGGLGTMALDAGTYKVYADQQSAQVDIGSAGLGLRAGVLVGDRTDASCMPGIDPQNPSASAASGTITLTSVSATQIAGTIDVTFKDGGYLKGPFTASGCAAPMLDTCTIDMKNLPMIPQCTSTPTCQ